jgi:hypothetical protein
VKIIERNNVKALPKIPELAAIKKSFIDLICECKSFIKEHVNNKANNNNPDITLIQKHNFFNFTLKIIFSSFFSP